MANNLTQSSQHARMKQINTRLQTAAEKDSFAPMVIMDCRFGSHPNHCCITSKCQST